MARSGMYVTKQSKVEDCRQWPMHYQGATGISKVSNISQLLSSFAKQMSIRLAADKTEDTCIKCLVHFNSQFTVNMSTGSNCSWQQPPSTPQTMLRYTIILCRVAYPLNNGYNTYRAVIIIQ